jgi:hypothetical protein
MVILDFLVATLPFRNHKPQTDDVPKLTAQAMDRVVAAHQLLVRNNPPGRAPSLPSGRARCGS